MIRTEKVNGGQVTVLVNGIRSKSKMRARTYKARGQTCKGKGKGAQAVRIDAKIEGAYNSLGIEAKRYDKEQKRVSQLNKRAAKRQARKATK